MDPLAIIKHAYKTLADSHPEKDAVALVADIEALVTRMVDAAKSLEATVVEIPETPAALVAAAPLTRAAEPQTLYPLPPLPAV